MVGTRLPGMAHEIAHVRARRLHGRLGLRGFVETAAQNFPQSLQSPAARGLHLHPGGRNRLLRDCQGGKVGCLAPAVPGGGNCYPGLFCGMVVDRDHVRSSGDSLPAAVSAGRRLDRKSEVERMTKMTKVPKPMKTSILVCAVLALVPAFAHAQANPF